MGCSAKLFTGDWLALAAMLPPASIDLFYVDPPFNTGLKQRSPARGESLLRRTGDAYADSWPTTGSYIAWAKERIVATLPALKPTANILLHCDWRTSHHLRLLLEELLGEECFVNHLIWCYGLGGSSPRRFARKHDDILFYCLNPDAYFFQPPMVPATSQRMRGKLKKATDVLHVAADVVEIPSLNNMASERTGYPTQKPLALLEMLVQACCPAGGTVLDACCGSGTTLVAAVNTGRNSIGGDRSADAIALVSKRLREAGGEVEAVG